MFLRLLSQDFVANILAAGMLFAKCLPKTALTLLWRWGAQR